MTPTEVWVGKHKLTLTDNDKLSEGGEGEVFRVTLNNQPLVAKVLFRDTPERMQTFKIKQAKLPALMNNHWGLDRAIFGLPLDLLHDQQGQVVGTLMPFYPGSDIDKVFTRQKRKALGISTRDMVNILITLNSDLRKIHAEGFVVGDLSGKNILLDSKNKQSYWIDTDSWQFHQFPCFAALEDYIAPELYGKNLIAAPLFKPEYDWYSYAVLCFRSLLLAHPYGGSYAKVVGIPNRVLNKITVFDPNVIYPVNAYPKELLTPELLKTFEEIIFNGQRGEFPVSALTNYARLLVACPQCGEFIPDTTSVCPHCQAQHVQTIHIQTELLIRTYGTILYSKLEGHTLHVISLEKDTAVLYSLRLDKKGARPTQRPLFRNLAGHNPRFEIWGDMLALNLAGDPERVKLYNLSGDSTKYVGSFDAAAFAKTGRAMFRSSYDGLYYVTANELLHSVVQNGQLHTESLQYASGPNTWLQVHQAPPSGKPIIFRLEMTPAAGDFYSLINGPKHYHVPLEDLLPHEELQDIVAQFSDQNLHVLRQTRFQGKLWVRQALINYQGKILTEKRVELSNFHSTGIRGFAFSNDTVLYPTDSGLIQEKLLTGTIKSVGNAQGKVAAGDTLYGYSDNLVVVGAQNVLLL